MMTCRSDDEEISAIPFVFKMPSTCAALAVMVEGKSPEAQHTIYQRILACHSIHLKPQNRSLVEVR